MKLIRASYYGRLSAAEIEHCGRIFTGFAKLHPDDELRASKFAGPALAEKRAQIKALKYELKLKKEKCDECRKFVKACETYKNWDKDSPTAKAVYRQLNRRIKEVNKLIDIINDKMDEAVNWDSHRQIVTNALRAKKENREK